MKHETDEQPAWGDEASAPIAFFATTSKRQAIIERRKGVRSLRGMLMRSRS
jgi:hypothetical protein